MSDSISSTFLKDERENTDQSLGEEREKTNKSLMDSQSTTAEKTDQKVQQVRKKSDEATSTARGLEDHKFNRQIDSAGPQLKDEKKLASDQLLRERDQSDKTIQLERRQADLALEKERQAKSVLESELLDKERKRTDENLSAERTSTDAEVRRTTDMLTDETAEHTKTKTILTTREEFLAIVSHDLKNPIGVASLCAEMLLEDPSFRDLGPQARSSVEMIKRNIDTSLRLISALLDMERIEGGKLHLELKTHNAVALLEEVADCYALPAAAKKIEMKIDCDDCKIFCDKDRILQVLSNLVSNAVKFTPVGGTITVRAVSNNKEAQLSVSDSGPGIAVEKSQKIFDRYAQLGAKDRAGLGLGLYISKKLVEAHGGTLGVRSQPGQGCIFTFNLPKSNI